MKKNKFLHKLLFAFSLLILVVGCDGDEDDAPGVTIDFSGIASTYMEADGTGTVTIPFRNSSAAAASNLTVVFGGTATEGEDFNLVAVSEEGVQLSIINDDDFESNETIRVQLTSSKSLTGNSIHNVTIVSDCGDKDGLPLSTFAGDYDAIEKYGPNPPAANWYGPYSLTITQDATNPNRFNMTDFYDSNRSAYFIVDVAAGTVHFPNQTPLPDPGAPTPLTNSSGTFSFCEVEGHLTLTIDLNYDGGDWEYYFEKH